MTAANQKINMRSPRIGVNMTRKAILLTPEIQEGGVHIVESVWWYEATSEKVVWSFENRIVTIDGSDGRQCIVTPQ
jgi:hypothetical protein